jgi:hypothetical protein
MKRTTRKPREFSLSNLFAKNSPFSWRAFFAFVTTMTVSTVLLSIGKLSESHWVEVSQWITGFFMTGETVRKFAKDSPVEAEALSPKESGET